jgi:alginate O-acetyltransferase complex protein AlgJ
MATASPTLAKHAKRGGPTDPSHDENLRRGIIHTEISRPVAAVLVAAFLLGIYAIPVSQAVMEKRAGDDILIADLFKHAPTRARIKQFEDDLEQASYPKTWTQPRLQEHLTRAYRVGNKKAVVGHGGWLYYKPGITYVGGPPFLDPQILEGRVRASLDAGEPPVQPDPRVAILAFHRALAVRGIKLVILPMPDKAMLQPLELHGRGDPGQEQPVPKNPDYDRFVSEMRAAGVAVFDPTPTPPVLAPHTLPRFLEQDTHWTPAWMEQVAGELGKFLRQMVPALDSPPPEPPRWKQVGMQVSRVGDIVDMLKLTEGQTVFAPRTVTIHQVQDASGAEWEPDPKAAVLLLGDSFTNVFSADAMGWGSSAGLGPQLAFALGRPVDVIAQNDSGAFATRQTLARELADDPRRLDGKRVVVWEFASRELAVGDWKAVDWSAAAEAR